MKRGILITLSLLALAFSANSFAAPVYSYSCNAKGPGLFEQTRLELLVSSRGVRAGLGDGSSNRLNWTKNFLVVDENYKPRNLRNAKFSRIPGAETLVDEEGQVNLYVENSMFQGSNRGLSKIEWRGETYESGLYLCTRTH